MNDAVQNHPNLNDWYWSADEGVQFFCPSLTAVLFGVASLIDMCMCVSHVYTWNIHRALLLAARQRESEPAQYSVATARVSRGKPGAWPSPMLGVITAAGCVPGVTGEWFLVLGVKTEAQRHLRVPC